MWCAGSRYLGSELEYEWTAGWVWAERRIVAGSRSFCLGRRRIGGGRTSEVMRALALEVSLRMLGTRGEACWKLPAYLSGTASTGPYY
jgi:hypothetical protein